MVAADSLWDIKGSLDQIVKMGWKEVCFYMGIPQVHRPIDFCKEEC